MRLFWFKIKHSTTLLSLSQALDNNVKDLTVFHRFLQMCAARTGQLLNLSSLGNDCGISHNTAKEWLSVSETSYILFFLQPHFQNFNKRLIKSPKLYFYDTGLACALLNLQQPHQVASHAMRGALFETWVVAEVMKSRFNRGLPNNLFFWRDSQHHEIDILFDRGDQLIPIEIKAGQTLNSDYFATLKYWRALTQQQHQSWLVYAGHENQQRGEIHVVSWMGVVEMMQGLNSGF